MKGDTTRDRKTPPLVSYFGDLVEDWEKYAMGYTYIKLKGMTYDDVLIKSIPVGLDMMPSDSKYSFACEVETVPEQDMTDEHRELYRRLKNLECELAWKGKIRKKGFFRSVSDELHAHVPEIEPSEELIGNLHANKNLMKLVNKTSPEELTIKLYSGVDITKPIRSPGDVLAHQVSFYHHPSRIVWIMRLVEGRYAICLNPYKLTSEICFLLDLIAEEVDKISRGFPEQMQGD